MGVLNDSLVICDDYITHVGRGFLWWRADKDDRQLQKVVRCQALTPVSQASSCTMTNATARQQETEAALEG